MPFINSVAGIPHLRCPLRQNTDGSRLGRGLESNSGILSGQTGRQGRRQRPVEKVIFGGNGSRRTRGSAHFVIRLCLRRYGRDVRESDIASSLMLPDSVGSAAADSVGSGGPTPRLNVRTSLSTLWARAAIHPSYGSIPVGGRIVR